MCFSIRADSPNDRAEWEIFLDNADNATGNYRVFIPLRGQVVSRRKFVESTGPPPMDWNLPLRLVNKVNNPRHVPKSLEDTLDLSREMPMHVPIAPQDKLASTTAIEGMTVDVPIGDTDGAALPAKEERTPFDLRDRTHHPSNRRQGKDY